MALTGVLLAETPVPDPEAWYRSDYGPLWADRPGERIDEILTHYADVVVTHGVDGAPVSSDKHSWLAVPMKEWLAEGWLSSQLAALETDRINAGTAAFKALWIDHYADGSTESSCGWYLADLVDGRWRFTQFADLDCEAHGLDAGSS